MSNGSGYDLAVAVQEDVPDLAMVGTDTFVQTFGHLYSAEDLQLFLDDNHTDGHYRALVENPDYQVWIARGNGQPVGYAVAGLCNLPVEDLAPRAGEVKRLYLLADHQSGGLGRRMMDEMMAWLVAEGFDPLYLSVYAENYGAQRFYARYGFEKVQEYDFMVGNHRDPELILMRTV